MYTAAAVVANVVLPKSDACKQARKHLSSKKSEKSLKITELVELDPAKMDNKIHSLCSNIIKEYEELNNLDVRIALSLLIICVNMVLP